MRTTVPQQRSYTLQPIALEKIRGIHAALRDLVPPTAVSPCTPDDVVRALLDRHPVVVKETSRSSGLYDVIGGTPAYELARVCMPHEPVPALVDPRLSILHPKLRLEYLAAYLWAPVVVSAPRSGALSRRELFQALKADPDSWGLTRGVTYRAYMRAIRGAI